MSESVTFLIDLENKLLLYKKTLLVGCAIILFCLLVFSAYLFGVHTSVPVQEVVSPAPQVRQSDGSVIAARQPATNITPASHKIPRHAVEERRIQVNVKPPAFVSQEGCKCDPPALDVNLSLVRDGDGRRVIASSPEGKVLSALDVPIEAGLFPEPHPWSAGISVGQDKSPGVWVERDLGRFRVGAELYRSSTDGLQGRARVGWSW